MTFLDITSNFGAELDPVALTFQVHKVKLKCYELWDLLEPFIGDLQHFMDDLEKLDQGDDVENINFGYWRHPDEFFRH